MVPTRIGQQVPGGYFVGINRISNNMYSVVVSPEYTEIKLQWKTTNTFTRNTHSKSNGLSNTQAMYSDTHPAAAYCVGLEVNGCNDLYLPSINEMESCYRNLKPSTSENAVRQNTPTQSAAGVNRSSIPSGNAYTLTTPRQTIATPFCKPLYTGWYWISTASISDASYSLVQNFSNGFQCRDTRSSINRVRAIRRIQIL